MISNLSQIFHILKDKYKELKKTHVECILEFLDKSKALHNPKRCLVCGTSLEYSIFFEKAICFYLFESSNLMENSIEDRMCQLCIIKIHSNPPKFLFVDNIFSSSISEPKLARNYTLLNYLNALNDSIILRSENESMRCKAGDIEKYLKKLRENEPFKIPNQNKFLGSIVRSYRNHMIRVKGKEIIEKQMNYKIETIEEQLKLIQENHKKAILKGELEEAKSFREIYCNLFELKLYLVEKLHKNTNY